MVQQNNMRNVQVKQFVSEIFYGTFESQSKEIYPRFISVMEKLFDSPSLSMGYEDDWEVLKEYQSVPLDKEIMDSINRSRPIVSSAADWVIISWIDPENAEFYQFRINPLAFVQIEDIQESEESL